MLLQVPNAYAHKLENIGKSEHLEINKYVSGPMSVQESYCRHCQILLSCRIHHPVCSYWSRELTTASDWLKMPPLQNWTMSRIYLQTTICGSEGNWYRGVASADVLVHQEVWQHLTAFLASQNMLQVASTRGGFAFAQTLKRKADTLWLRSFSFVATESSLRVLCSLL